MYADRSLEAYGVRVGQTLEVGPNQYPVNVIGWVSDTDFLLQGSLWGSEATWRAVLASARPDAVLAPGTFQVLTVVTAPGANPTEVASAIDAATGGTTRTVTRRYAVDSLPGLKQQRSTFNSIIYTTFFVAALVVALFFALLILERTGLYAVFKAIGASSRQIFTQVVAQAVILAVVAFVLGGLLAWVATFAIPPQVPLQLTSARAVEVFVGLVVMSAIGSAISLRRVVHVDPTPPSAEAGGTMPALQLENVRKVYQSATTRSSPCATRRSRSATPRSSPSWAHRARGRRHSCRSRAACCRRPRAGWSWPATTSAATTPRRSPASGATGSASCSRA